MSDLDSLFNPRAIAIVGASAEGNRPGAQALHTLRERGYGGGVYPVNAKYRELGGYRCHASLAEVGDDCDLAVIALPAVAVPEVIAQCGRKGVRNAVVLSGGFRENGEEGGALEAHMLATAARNGVRIVGPNCLGVVNVQARVYAAFGSLTRRPHWIPGGVSAVLQSGGFGVSMVIRCALAGVGFRYLVASGNESDISMPELIEADVDDPQTRVILAYMEGVSDGRSFMAAARRALAAGKPIVVLKAGNTRQGKLAAASHTANLTGSYDIYRAAFRQCGVVEVEDIDQAVDAVIALAALERVRLPRGRNVALMGGSGGSAAVFADAADRNGLVLPAPAGKTLEVLKSSLPALSSLQNPIDYTAGYPRPDSAEGFLRAFDAILDDPDFHQLGVMYAPIMGAQLKLGAELLAQAASRSDKPVFVFSAMSEELAPEGLGILKAAGIPVLPSPKRVAAAMAVLASYAEALAARDRPLPEMSSTSVTLPPGAATLNEHESKVLLKAMGVAVTEDRLVEPGAGLPAGLRFPVAVKIVSRDIAHKTDIGAVQLNVPDRDALAAAVAAVVANARRVAPQARLDGVLVSGMVAGGVETIVGVVNDEGFGPVVAFGLGGVLAETLNDMSYRVAPFGVEEARCMIAELRAAAIFSGVRGRPACDVAALAATLSAVSQMAWQLRDRLAELDINPLLVLPAGEGVVAADALVVLEE